MDAARSGGCELVDVRVLENLLGRAGAHVRQDQVDDALEELANERLVDRNQFKGPGPTPGTSYDYFYTRLGPEFLLYCRG